MRNAVLFSLAVLVTATLAAAPTVYFFKDTAFYRQPLSAKTPDLLFSIERSAKPDIMETVQLAGESLVWVWNFTLHTWNGREYHTIILEEGSITPLLSPDGKKLYWSENRSVAPINNIPQKTFLIWTAGFDGSNKTLLYEKNYQDPDMGTDHTFNYQLWGWDPENLQTMLIKQSEDFQMASSQIHFFSFDPGAKTEKPFDIDPDMEGLSADGRYIVTSEYVGCCGQGEYKAFLMDRSKPSEKTMLINWIEGEGIVPTDSDLWSIRSVYFSRDTAMVALNLSAPLFQGRTSSELVLFWPVRQLKSLTPQSNRQTRGWIDHRTVLFEDTNGNISTFDVQSGRETPFTQGNLIGLSR